MKKLVFLLTMSIWAVTVCAQDVIIKRDATKIEALILEVSEDEVRYKTFSNQSGPTFVVKTNDIATIIYKNGDVQVFEKKAEPTTSNGNLRNGSPIGGEVSYIGGNYYLNDKMMTKSDFRYYLMKNCMPAYNYYKKCSDMAYSGLALMSAGALIMIFGGAFLDELDDGKGAIMLCVGAATLLVGTPLCGVGFGCRNKACYIYNERCANTAYNRNRGVHLNLQTSKDGLGIALKF